MKKLIPIGNLQLQADEGIHWKSSGAARWCERTSEQTGLSAAFIRIGRRVFIDPEKFHELARKNDKRARREVASAN